MAHAVSNSRTPPDSCRPCRQAIGHCSTSFSGRSFLSGICAHLLAVVGVWPVEELDAGEGAGELAAAGDPGDGGALVEEEGGLEEVDALLLDEAHAQHLALLLIRYELRRQHLAPKTPHHLSPSAQAITALIAALYFLSSTVPMTS